MTLLHHRDKKLGEKGKVLIVASDGYCSVEIRISSAAIKPGPQNAVSILDLSRCEFLSCPSRDAQLYHYVQRYYPDVKRQYPGEGRRRWRLRVAQQFWQRNREVPPSVRSSCLSQSIIELIDTGNRASGNGKRRFRHRQ